MANYTYNFGLVETNISSSIILSNSVAIFIFLISIALTRCASFRCSKLMSLIIFFSGVLLISNSDSHESDETGEEQSEENTQVMGDIFTLISAIGFAVYAIYLEYNVGDHKVAEEKGFRMDFFLGFVGIFNNLIGLPILLVFDIVQIEILQLPDLEVFLMLLSGCFLANFCFDFGWSKSVVLIGPLPSAIGQCLSIPLGMFAEWIYAGKDFDYYYKIGSLLILIGFIAINVAGIIEDKIAQWKQTTVEMQEFKPIVQQKDTDDLDQEDTGLELECSI